MRTERPNLSQAIRWLHVTYKGEKWDRWAERPGDWSRDALMDWATRPGGLGLAQVVRAVGVKDQAAAQAVKRFGQALSDDPERQRFLAAVQRQLSTL